MAREVCDDYITPEVCAKYMKADGTRNCSACLYEHRRIYRDGIEASNTEAVDHPAHYNMGRIEVIDAIDDWGLDFELGNVIKYVARSAHKGKQIEDLRKAMWYLERAISLMAASEETGR